MKVKHLFTLSIFILIFISCGEKRSKNNVSADLMSEQSSPAKDVTENAEPVDRKIIREGEISFRTADVSKTRASISAAVKEMNGYVSKENTYNYNDRLEHRLVLRVPEDKFDQLLNRISENVDKLDSKNIDVLDVTEEYIDISARIKTKKELQNRYQELLKKANKVEEILMIEKEIGQLQTDIESTEGRLKYLQDRISYSSLTVTYYEKISSGFHLGSKFTDAIRNGWDGFLWVLVGITHLWVFIIIAAIAIYIIIKQEKKRKKKSS